MNLPANAVRIQDANNWVSEQDLKELHARPLPAGTVVFAKIGEALKQNRLRQVARETLVDNNMMGAIPRADRVEPRFFYYALSQFDFADIAQGTALPYLTISALSGLTLDVPTLPEQRAIAHFLGTLDDKIEINRRMNETLEAMARALFTSWFVDFDPVRAKAEGRDTGLPSHVADLFPDSFEDSELGEIPKGWTVGPLDSVLVLQRGFDLPAPQRTPGAYPVLAASGPSGTHNVYMVRGPGVTTGRSGVLGRVFYVDDDFWPLNTSLWVKEFRHSRPAYAFHLLLGIDFASFDAGSAVPTLNRNHVRNLPTLQPPMGLIEEFERVATQSITRQRHNDGQSGTLAALRDTLLPKLISGELRVEHVHFDVEGSA
jgi:type I restriction enzyme S subunit